MTIGDLCEFKVDFPEADFWLVRKGSESTVGTPTKEFSPEHIGVKVTSPNMDAGYLFYYFMFLQQKGAFTMLSKGTLKLKNIRISDIKNIPVVMR